MSVARDRRPNRGRPSAFTLVEMVVALTMASILLAACGSIILLATRALGTGKGGTSADQAALARAAAERLAADLKMATSFSVRTSTAATFTVPDRNGDTLPEVIAYAWAGPGSPLTYQCNGQPSPAAVIADNVRNFNMDAILRTVAPPPSVEGPEQLLVSRDWAIAGDIKSFGVKTGTWPAESFKPSLPVNAVSWKITRIKLKLKKWAPNGMLTIRVTNTDAGGKPTGSALDSATFDPASLTSAWTWVEVAFSNLSGIDPRAALAVVVTGNKNSTAYVAYDEKATNTAMSWCTTNNSGGSWTVPVSNRAMEIYVYGKVTVQP